MDQAEAPRQHPQVPPHAQDLAPYAALVGLDWAKDEHDVAVLATDRPGVELATVKATPEAMGEWITRLRRRFPAARIAVCLEQTRGCAVVFLMSYEFVDLFLVNPKQLKAFRETFVSSGAKDDPTDAQFALELLKTHRDRLRLWQPDDVLTRKLALLTEDRRRAVEERVRVMHQMQEQLHRHFPQALAWIGADLSSRLAIEFLTRWPTLARLQAARRSSIEAVLGEHSRRRPEQIAQIVEAVRVAQPLTTDDAILTAGTLKIQRLVPMMRVLNDSIAQYDAHIEESFAAHPDGAIFESLPGAGKALAPRLLAAFGSQRERFRSAQELQDFCGIAPVQRRSGKTCIISMRWACPKFLRQSFHEFAAASVRYCPWAAAFYQAQRARGKSHHVAVRALAYKWIRIIFRCWIDHTPYVENRYLCSLMKRGSPCVDLYPSASSARPKPASAQAPHDPLITR